MAKKIKPLEQARQNLSRFANQAASFARQGAQRVASQPLSRYNVFHPQSIKRLSQTPVRVPKQVSSVFQGANRVVNAPLSTYNVFQQPDINSFIRNRIVDPARQVPTHARQLVAPGRTLPQRAFSGLGIVAGLTPGVEDLAFAGADYLKAARASHIRGGKFAQNIQAGKKAFTGEEFVGLGSALTTDPTLEAVGNVAELPLLLAGGVAYSRGARKAIDANTVEEIGKLRNYFGSTKYRPLSKQTKQAIKDVDRIFDRFVPKKGQPKLKAGLSTQQKIRYLDGLAIQSAQSRSKALVNRLGFKAEPVGGTKAILAAPTKKTAAKIKAKEFADAGKQARVEFNDWQRALRKQEGLVTQKGLVKEISKQIRKSTKGAASKRVGVMKDITGFKAQTRDVYRNFREAYGKGFGDVKRTVLDPFDKSKGNLAKSYKNWSRRIGKEVVDRLGIKKGSKESAAVQMFGEGNITSKQLVQRFGSKKAKQIQQADKWFRKEYDKLLGEVNDTMRRVYPNNPDKIIPRRNDYYRHFTEMAQGVRGLLNIFDSPSQISSKLSGVSEFTKPKSKFLSFAQKRVGGKTEVDAVGGFIDYVKAAEYNKHIDPHTAKFRALADELSDATSEGEHVGKINNFIEYLHDFSNDLAGKTNPADRFIQKVIPGGRKTFRAINWLNNRVKANVILGNMSSSIAQIFNVPQGIANAGARNSVKGLGSTVANIFGEATPIKKSSFISERYLDSTFNKFDSGMLNKTRDFAAWMIGVLDEVGTKYIWNSHYAKALADKIPNPSKYADDTTRSMVAGRGIGEVPLIQKSKMFQLVAPFQLEVANAWHVMGGWMNKKQFGKLMSFFVLNHVFNKGAEAIRGSGVVFDPIQAGVEAYTAYTEEADKKVGALRAAGRVGGEVLGNVPLGQTAAATYPEYGIKVGGESVTRKELFGKGDPTRFGSGILLTKGLQDPLSKILPPFGGVQAKRTLQGLGAVREGASTTKTGRVRFPVEQTPANIAKAAAFGQFSLPGAREYFDKQGKSESKSISNEFNKLKTDEQKAQLWDQMVKDGRINKDNISDIKKQFRDVRLEISGREKTIRTLPVKDGSRSRAVAKQFKKAKTQAEKAKLWEDYVAKGIITKQVAAQLKQMEL